MVLPTLASESPCCPRKLPAQPSCVLHARRRDSYTTKERMQRNLHCKFESSALKVAVLVT